MVMILIQTCFLFCSQLNVANSHHATLSNFEKEGKEEGAAITSSLRLSNLQDVRRSVSVEIHVTMCTRE